MIDTNSAVTEAATELGFTENSTEESSGLTSETESTEAEGGSENDKGSEPSEGEVSTEETPTPDSEGEESVIPDKTEEAPKTAKEIEEIEQKVKDLELKENAFMERMQAREKEFQAQYQEKLKAHDEMDSWLAEVANTDAELFEVIKESFQGHQKQFNNPQIAALREEQAKIKQELDGFKAQASDEVTRTKLNAEMNEVKSTLGKQAEEAGVKVDWNKVQDAWADNPKLSLESALFAVYGSNMMKAVASKAKVQAVEKKVQSRPTVSTAGNVARTNASKDKDVPSDAFGAVMHYARQMGVKA